MKRLFAVFFLAGILSACDDGANQKEPASEPAESPGSVSYGGGGGQVRVGNPQATRQSVEESYKQALDSIAEKKWDNARETLTEALRQAAGTDLEKDIRTQLKVVDRGLYSQPTHEVTDLFLKAPEYYDTNVSVRGLFVPGGKVGEATYYFWTRTAKRKIQCRYKDLSLEDKQKILLLKEGAQVLVRGALKSPWGSNPNPYLDLTYFKLEKLAPKPEKNAAP